MLIVTGIIIALITGLAIKLVSDFLRTNSQITWMEFVVGAAICMAVVVPVTVIVGTNIAKGNNLEYKEFWNGWETKAVWKKTKCTRDGSCTYEYDCDPYEVWVDTSYTDADGNYVSDGRNGPTDKRSHG